ncbi:MAG: hypothetical protein ACRETW_08320 [Stenotrophobium sp.]
MLAAAVCSGSGSDFDHPASSDTSQQFAPINVQRQDTPQVPDYDCAEPDTTLPAADHCSDIYNERFELFGFVSALSRLTALYLDPADSVRFGKPQISGFNAAGAWKIERGNPAVTIAILDTGIQWDRCGLRRQIHLNTGELPLPEDAQGQTHPAAGLGGFDLDGDGAITVDDYASDPRVGRAFKNSCGGAVTGKDLLNAFGHCQITNHQLGACPAGGAFDNDGNGYANDIAGWNFFDDNNDPTDRSSYFAAGNHGSGRASDAVESGTGGNDIGICPHCQFEPLRVWDTFVSDGDTFGLAMMYAADNHVNVIEGADGSLYHSAFAEVASQYAYQKGLVQTYSGDDLNTGNHNYPANYNHTLLIQGTVPDSKGLGSNNAQFQQGQAFICGTLLANLPPVQGVCIGSNVPVGTYFRGANTTQYGGHSSISMEGATGSENTGKASGAAGLVVSAGLDFGTQPLLSADETREILEQTAEDVTQPNTLGTGLPDAAQPGWDVHFGYGRANLGAAVQAVKDGNIPPEVAIVTPDWYVPLTGATVEITGLARARRAAGGNFHYKLEWGAGLAPTTWTTVTEADASGTVTDFGALNLAAVRAATAAFTVPPDAGGPTFSLTSRNPYQDQFTVRLTVTDPAHPNNLPGVDRKVLTAIPDGQNLSAGYPRRLGAGGEAPIRYADINGDNVPELIVPTEDGLIHAYEPDGSELPGWPVQTDIFPRAASHPNAPGFLSGAVAMPREPPRAPTVADLDGDGIPEIITAAGVHVYVFEPDGSMRAGFPVGDDPALCAPSQESQPLHHPKCGFLASPAVARLDGPGKPLSIVAPALDGHLYAWHADGTPVAWSPLALVDPNIPAAQQMVAESINEPAIGDLNGDGVDDIVAATNEVYGGGSALPLPSGGDVSFIGSLSTTFTPVYAIDGKTGKFLSGWPVQVSGIIQDVLPFIGPGQDPVLVQVGGTQQIVASATGTGLAPVTSSLATYGVDGSLGKNMNQALRGVASLTTDPTPGINLFESAAVGNLLGSSPGAQLSPLAVVKYQIGAAQAANLLLVGQNFPYNHEIGAWDASTGLPLPAFPVVTDDYQFLSSSTIASVNPASMANQVVAGTGLGLLHAYDGMTGQDAPGFPKVTGGWLFAPAALSSDSRVAAITREGYLFQWSQPTLPPCQSEWPSFRHDQQGSGNYNRDGTPPGAVSRLSATAVTGGIQVQFVAPGDDGLCGTASSYRVLVNGQPAATRPPAPAAADTTQSFTLGGADASAQTVTVQAIDKAGNVGYPVSVSVQPAGTGSSSGGTGGSSSSSGGSGSGSGSSGGGSGSGSSSSGSSSSGSGSGSSSSSGGSGSGSSSSSSSGSGSSSGGGALPPTLLLGLLLMAGLRYRRAWMERLARTRTCTPPAPAERGALIV